MVYRNSIVILLSIFGIWLCLLTFGNGESIFSEELKARSLGKNGKGTLLSSALHRKDLKGTISKKRAGQQPTTQIEPESKPQSEENHDEVKDTEVPDGYNSVAVEEKEENLRGYGSSSKKERRRNRKKRRRRSKVLSMV